MQCYYNINARWLHFSKKLKAHVGTRLLTNSDLSNPTQKSSRRVVLWHIHTHMSNNEHVTLQTLLV